LRDKENIVAFRPYQRGMVMHVLKYLDDIRPTDDIPEIIEAAKQRAHLEPEEISLAKILVDKFRSKQLDLSDYSDSYAQDVRGPEGKHTGEKIKISLISYRWVGLKKKWRTGNSISPSLSDSIEPKCVKRTIGNV
jgi:hypothetical protein